MKKKKLILRNVFGKPVEIEGGSGDGGIIVADENFDWNTAPTSPIFVYNPETGKYLVWNGTEYKSIQIGTPVQRVKYITANNVTEDDLLDMSSYFTEPDGTTVAYRLEPGVFHIFTTDVRNPILCCPELNPYFFGETHVLDYNYEYHGRFTVPNSYLYPIEFIGPYYPERYSNDYFESGHIYEFHISGGIVLFTDVTVQVVDIDAPPSSEDTPLTPNIPGDTPISDIDSDYDMEPNIDTTP